MAERLAIDPLTLRDRIDPSPVRREERRIGAERVGWQRRHKPGADTSPIKRGLGVAQSLWMANVQLNSSCEVRLMRDGSVEVLSSVQDIGTGTRTVMAQTVAEVFGLRAENITVRIGDTEFPPGPPSYGSRATASITPPARTAAWHVLQSLLPEVALSLNAAPEDLIAHDGRVWSATTQAGVCHSPMLPHGCAPIASLRWLRAATIMPVFSGAWVTPLWRIRLWAAFSSPRWQSIPRLALCGWSASLRCKIAAGR